LIGLPLSIVSTTASSRARSAMPRAIRNRYLPRSSPDIFDQTVSYAARAARTASSTSSVDAHETVASSSSVAGLMVGTSPPRPSTNRPPTNIW